MAKELTIKQYRKLQEAIEHLVEADHAIQVALGADAEDHHYEIESVAVALDEILQEQA